METWKFLSAFPKSTQNSTLKAREPLTMYSTIAKHHSSLSVLMNKVFRCFSIAALSWQKLCQQHWCLNSLFIVGSLLMHSNRINPAAVAFSRDELFDWKIFFNNLCRHKWISIDFKCFVRTQAPSGRYEAPDRSIIDVLRVDWDFVVLSTKVPSKTQNPWWR